MLTIYEPLSIHATPSVSHVCLQELVSLAKAMQRQTAML